MKSLIPLIIILVFLLPGCGKKAPPIPPRQKPVPAVSDLKYSIDGDILTLAWTIPKGKEKAKTAPDGFIVYRSKRPISDSPCKNCPKLFQKVSDIPADIKIDAPGYENKNIEYREEIEKGFVYTYKVVLYTKSGVAGADSNYIEFNF
ncbi:MAG: hypothetical protein JRD05_07695 [Deltaproteobacteria bacterium]|nr:hypothetical protein [Deltaproteobacteria bacterium]